MQRLTPWYVTGLVEGEGCFHVGFQRRRRLRVGIETRPSFSLSLNLRDRELLEALQTFFGCGAIRLSRFDHTYKYEVRSVEALVKKIIPHFQQYPLQGAKRENFDRFARICQMVHGNLHRSARFLPEIIDLAYQMNPTGSRPYRKEDLLRVLGEVKG